MSLRQLPKCLRIDAVAFLDPMRNVIKHMARTGQLQAGPEHAGAADAVDVVVTVDDDRPVLADGLGDPLGGLADAGKRLGIVQAAQLGLEERGRPLRVVQSAVDQELRHERRDSSTSAECRDPTRIKRPEPPAS